MNTDQKPPYYCYAWMPITCHAHDQINPIRQETAILPIDDGVGIKRSIQCTFKDESIYVHIIDDVFEGENKKTTSINFNIINSRRNGTIEFELSSDDYEKLKQNELIETKENGEECVANAVYHILKDLYHKHRYHEVGIDSDFLVMPVYKKRVDITKPDNIFITSCFSLFENRFNNATEFLREDMEIYELIKNSNNPKCNEELSERNIIPISDIDLLEARQSFDDRCESILGYVFYCKTLQNSIYNHSCHLNNDPQPDAEERLKKLRRTAHNIDCAIREIKWLKIKNMNDMQFNCFKDEYLNSERADKMSRFGIKLGIESTSVGLWSISFAIGFFALSLFISLNSCIAIKISVLIATVGTGIWLWYKLFRLRKEYIENKFLYDKEKQEILWPK